MREQIERTLGEVLWSDLRAHVARDAVIVVGEEIDLLDAGEALARNVVAVVEPWIAAGKVAKPTADELLRWSQAEGLHFQAVVVAPFVLVRRPREAHAGG
ncbi:DUF2288 family protein [Chondromyces apiculatus]|uniref:DUF2288 domain-containing protein n=1 Tax=Chondromyces apiculatus DSM 436 TaxID=1192034 RepID=A0A017ST73_9BACT|nr:DUF2288 family protein [Chondromyces apiculatus]EYF00154.1 Hypothetical protein CAP_1141 [Chondromyces apiculatus DSM 436]